ncbi:hypothetical protein [Mesorhizobium sp. B4-1-4]|uniref:hypothetical protein n=1 Tax=Mesorhizobium sp. B4-1-4 TaxID=2589888 RepID=UPI001D01A33C|nr:hypothetical protein [Mesorhizobium sp. B4-1-4]UCI30241.1 hypothetical protein FJW03_20820 [Mesorhizobium sp. B4-1-4]
MNQTPALVTEAKQNEAYFCSRGLARHGNVRHIFAGHVHRLIAGSWRGIPVSTLRSTNHQTALDFSDSWRLGEEAPAYAVIFIDADGVIVHFREFPIAGQRMPPTGSDADGSNPWHPVFPSAIPHLPQASGSLGKSRNSGH